MGSGQAGLQASRAQAGRAQVGRAQAGWAQAGCPPLRTCACLYNVMGKPSPSLHTHSERASSRLRKPQLPLQLLAGQLGFTLLLSPGFRSFPRAWIPEATARFTFPTCYPMLLLSVVKPPWIGLCSVPLWTSKLSKNSSWG